MFKNTVPTKLYWILFPIEDLRQVVETAKRILTKEKLDRQLNRQFSSTPFMSIRDSHNRKVSFDTKEELGDKIDKLTVMIGKLATRDSRTGRQFKPQIHQNRGRGQSRSYNQRHYQNRYSSNNRSNSGDRGQYRQDRGKPRYKQNYRRGNLRVKCEELLDKIEEENTETAIEMTVMTEAGTDLEIGHFPETIATMLEREVQAIVGPDQHPEQVQIVKEFDVIIVGNMTISQGTVPLLGMKKK